MKDLELKNPRVFGLVKEESLRQISKVGIQDYDPFEWLAYITEEVGELSQAISEFKYRRGLQSNIIKESVQAATLLLKVAEMFLEYDRCSRDHDDEFEAGQRHCRECGKFLFEEENRLPSDIIPYGR